VLEKSHLIPEIKDIKTVFADYGILDTAAEAAYDDIAILASQICGTPISYVSFVDNNRQWFKARVGFNLNENTLDKSFCRHALKQGSLLVIPDLALDTRTQNDDMVTSDPHLRFYAGALIKSPDHTVLGTLCVMDVNPHPLGLSPQQQSALLALARQVMELLELRRSIRERDTARTRAQTSEQRYRTVFASAVDYAIVVMDRQGRVTDWSEGASRILNWSKDEILGKTIDVIFTPEDRDAQIPQLEMSNALTQGRGTDERWHIRKDGTRFWASGEMMPLQESDDSISGFVKILRNKTKQRELEIRQNALFELVEKLNNSQSSNEILDAAVTVLQKHMVFDRAGFGRIDSSGQKIDIEEAWCAENLPVLAGQIPFSSLGAAASAMLQGETVAAADIENDQRLANSKAIFAAMKLRAIIHAPIMEHGKPASVFIINSQHRQDWTEHEINLVRAIADRTHPALARIKAEQQQKVMNEELSHRLKNTLAVVNGIANQTLKGSADAEAYDAFRQRIMALGAAHQILFHQDWIAGQIHPLVSATLALHSEISRMDITGPDIDLGPTAAVSLSLLLHELATNAIKYGSLSGPIGGVSVSWCLTGDREDKILTFSWKEIGGPTIFEPLKKGFGSKLISAGLAGNGQVKLFYKPEGFEAEFKAPLSAIRAITD
jgi:PAS domain S-box-containing protein